MSLKRNVIANYLGQAWTAVMGLVFVPVYIKYLGMESYGLIGIFIMLQAWLSLLDMGMTPTLSREMARYTAGQHTEQSIRDLLRTLEIIAVTLASLLYAGLYFSATWLANHWLQTEKIAPAELAQAITVMGLVIALRFVEGLYRSAIIGLQQQVWLNIAGAVLATLRSGGVVLVLIWIAPTIEAFFFWQGIISIITIVTFIAVTYRHLPVSPQPAQFSLPQLQAIGRFAGGMMLTTFLALLLTQVDKIILSRLLSLELFGYYTLASIVAGTLYQFILPITQAYLPRFTELATQDNTDALIKIYHQGAQLINVLVIPAALTLVLFGDRLLLLWTNNPLLTENVTPLLTLIGIGTLLNGFMNMPYLLSLAYGWARFSVYLNLIAAILLVPSMIWATLHYGAIGAAWIWLILNAGYILIGVHFLYWRLLSSEKWQWYKNLITSTVAALLVGKVCAFLLPADVTKTMEFISILVSSGLMAGAAWLCSPALIKRRIL